MVKNLMDRYGANHIWWRYDPVIFSQKQNESWHLKNFKRLAKAMRGTPRCVMSLLLTEGSYRHVAKRVEPILEATGDQLANWTLTRKAKLLARLGKIALSYGIRPEICAQPKVADAANLHQASCMDLELLKRVIPGLPNLPVKSTRHNCNCRETKDIGNFDTCDNNCIYCSANKHLDKKMSIVNRIDPRSVWLYPKPLDMPIPR